MVERGDGGLSDSIVFAELPENAMKAAPSADVLELLSGEDRFIAATWGVGHDGENLFHRSYHSVARLALGTDSESLEYRKIDGLYSRYMDRIFNSLMLARDKSSNITDEQRATVNKVFSYLRAQGYKDGIATNDIIRIARRKQGSDISNYLEKGGDREKTAKKKKSADPQKKQPTTHLEILRARGYKIYTPEERNKRIY